MGTWCLSTSNTRMPPLRRRANSMRKRRARRPKLFPTTQLKSKRVHLHFFINGCSCDIFYLFRKWTPFTTHLLQLYCLIEKLLKTFHVIFLRKVEKTNV